MQDESVGWSLAHMLLGAFGQAALTDWPILVCLAGLVGATTVVAVYRERQIARSGIHDVDRMDGRAFERRLGPLFARLGYRVEETPYVGDYGADIVISKDGKRIAVQAKRSKRPVGVQAVQEVVSARDFYRCTQSLVVTNAAYTAQARKLAAATGTELWDRRRLIDALLAPDVPARADGSAAPTPATGRPRVCRTCGKRLSPKVLAFCLDHPERFGGHGYCFEHQRSVRSADPFAML